MPIIYWQFPHVINKIYSDGAAFWRKEIGSSLLSVCHRKYLDFSESLKWVRRKREKQEDF